jgi:predicted PurR-regulated permease PerM
VRLGKDALALRITLITLPVLVLLFLLEGPKLRTGILALVPPARAARYSQVASEVNRSITGYVLGNMLTSVLAGIVIFVPSLTLLIHAGSGWCGAPDVGKCS